MVTASVSSASWGHIAFSPSLGMKRSRMRVPSATDATSRTVQTWLRAKPCAGLSGSSGCGPNQGQHTGAPPRKDLPGMKVASGDSQMTSE